MNQSCEITSTTLPIIAFRKGSNLKQNVCTTTLHNIEKLVRAENNHHKGKFVQCNLTRCLSGQQLNLTATFKNNQTNKKLKKIC